ncbi:MAG: outer membrane beta-barrel protein [Erythrobacter sp.]|jgi:outer membrane immunogenic protein|uniref:outer membrane protein n=1 Tax=Qipengyuania TaxID=1855416 RepID=UPI00209F7444|nr:MULTISPECIES: outer membrane beta-barrel protein [Qipengyuania]MCP2018987.1 outer membrane immunogenic protein [Qipengyuania citrea]MDE0902824.1 outer membrane beta-barrel protein [Erythrobacter sp.]WPL58306.1 outer membrane beta-barrel protein [Qipengyuania sp. HL-TH5]
MKKSTFLATAIFAGAFAQPAFAQDAEPRFFDGFYVGGSFGLDAIDDENGEGITFDTDGDGEYGDGVITTTGANAFSPGYCNGAANGAEASDGCSDDKSRYGYGIRIGFDQRIGNGPVVAGLLVEGALSESEDYSTGFSTTPASYTFVRGLDKSVAVRGRLGVSPGSGRGLLYVTGGVAYADIDHDFVTTNTANSFTMTNDDDWQLGGQIGAGGELYLTDNISFGLEYLYSRYDDDDAYVLVGAGTAPATNPFLLDSGETALRPSDPNLNIHSIRTTLNFRF